ncbi:Ribokinase-like protein [Dioszegia hungarica]|uniref:Ribokinase-like protein n=1 Tax=Dioszegia hungarica TaxID=4972 RepID=A0AA38GZW9_9TREE|nr:Ribokinase-like protein [Dioszegia hungarica]KAI9632042.1 Ribokinase-like protein [Dioszegia hungarica]
MAAQSLDLLPDGTSSSPRGRVVTLEEFIIDIFTQIDQDGVERPVDRPDEQIGGGGSYAIIGARLFLPSSRLGMMVDYTPSTLPQEAREQLQVYGKSMWVFRERHDGHPTSRSVNRYSKDLRVFEYLSPPRLLTPVDILETHWLDHPDDAAGGISAIHMISGTERLEGFERDMQRIRDQVGTKWDPKIVWEPHQYDVFPSSIPLFRRITPQIDILSPNHSEVISLLSLPDLSSSSQNDQKLQLESASQTLLSWKPRIGVVIRAGAMGACYLAKENDEVKWIPAYWSEGCEEPDWVDKVVDPTGAGNAFCGAMAAALSEGMGIEIAVMWGTVAASFVVQQHGLPSLTTVSGKEVWAGDEPARRVRALQDRVSEM